jgi:hypothetical protein
VKVKCPKCRLTFEVTTIPGITEVACNCPRCGTPFTYQLTEEEAKANDSKAPQSPNREQEQPDTYKTTRTDVPNAEEEQPTSNADYKSDEGQRAYNGNSSASQQNQNNYHRPAQPTMPNRGFGQPMYGPQPPNQSPKNDSCFSSCLQKFLIFVIGIALIIVLVNKCSGSSHDDYDSSSKVEKVTNSTSTSTSHESDDFVEVNAQEAPDWIQGTWEYDDNGEDGLGHITVVIHGNHLKEQINDMEAAEGTFYYSSGVLHFESPDGRSRCDYPLNLKHKNIEWQEGKYMHKTY